MGVMTDGRGGRTAGKVTGAVVWPSVGDGPSGDLWAKGSWRSGGGPGATVPMGGGR
ncbi:hypothetical protein [Streptomyces sp. NPDC001020]